jgi:biopolymer transport protein ExbD
VKLRRTKQPESGPFVFIPLATVTLLLLAFFVLSSNFVLRPGIALALPGTSFALPPQPNTIFISIAAGTPPRIYVQDTPTSFDQLASVLARLATDRPPVIIRADRHTNLETVMRVADTALGLGLAVALAGTAAPAP